MNSNNSDTSNSYNSDNSNSNNNDNSNSNNNLTIIVIITTSYVTPVSSHQHGAFMSVAPGKLTIKSVKSIHSP